MSEAAIRVEATPLNCRGCGRSSTWTDAFRVVGKAGAAKHYCPRCKPPRNWPREILFLAVCVAAGFGAAAFFRDVDFSVRSVALLTFIFIVAQYPLLVLHEFGHVLAAWLVRATPIAIVIGVEPWTVNRDFLGIRWRIGRLTGVGFTYHESIEGLHARWRIIAATAGGPLMNALIAFTAIIVASGMPGRFIGVSGKAALLAVGIASGWMAFLNLWPRHLVVAHGKLPSDGQRILDLLRGKMPDALEARASTHVVRAWMAFTDANYDGSIREAERARAAWDDSKFTAMVATLHSAALCESDRAEAAIELLLPLEESIEDPGARAIALNNLAWANLLLDEPGAIERGIALSDAARAIAPWEEALSVTAACLLAASASPDNGRGARAREIIGSLDRARLDRRSSAYRALARGLVSASEGDGAEALRQLGVARDLQATAAPLRLLERRIASI